MSFGKTYLTRTQANQAAKAPDVNVRKLSKRLFPHRKKLYHVGTYLDFLNFA